MNGFDITSGFLIFGSDSRSVSTQLETLSQADFDFLTKSQPWSQISKFAYGPCVTWSFSAVARWARKMVLVAATSAIASALRS